MKQELPRCHLRFVTAEAYDRASQRVRNSVVERSVAEYAIEEPIGAVHEGAARYREDLWQTDIDASCVNPLRDEPHPAMVAAVHRFGVVGLIAGALGTALLRWWKTLNW